MVLIFLVMSRPHGPNTFEFKFHILTPHLSKHKAVFIGCEVLIECFLSMSTKFVLQIFMTERLGLMVEEAQAFRENHI